MQCCAQFKYALFVYWSELQLSALWCTVIKYCSNMQWHCARTCTVKYAVCHSPVEEMCIRGTFWWRYLCPSELEGSIDHRASELVSSVLVRSWLSENFGQRWRLSDAVDTGGYWSICGTGRWNITDCQIRAQAVIRIITECQVGCCHQLSGHPLRPEK